MASVYVIWERSSRSFVGPPLVFPASADATSQITKLKQKDGRTDQKPAKTYDVITVTV